MKTLEYKAPGGEMWRCGEFDALHEKFNLGDKDGFGLEQGMVDFHKVMSMQGGVIWDAVQRLYSVWPLFGVNPESEKEWNIASIAKKAGLSKPLLEKNLAKAVEYWVAKKGELIYTSFLQNDDSGGVENTLIDEGAGVVVFDSLYSDFDEEKVAGYLSAVGLDDLKDPALRLCMADRVNALWNELQQKNMRQTAIAVLKMEVNIHHAGKSKDWCYERMAKVQGLSEPTKDDRKEIAELEKRIRDLDKSFDTQVEKHSKMLTRMGVDEADQNQQKRTFIKSISYMFDRVAKYYADPERNLLDGVFTPAEISWLLTPTGMRPAQYRPDVVVRLEEALLPENFYDPDYEPTPLARDVVRDLHKIVQYVREDMEPEEIAGIDDVEAGGEEGYEVASLEKEIIAADEAASDEVQGGIADIMRSGHAQEEGVIG